MLGNITLPMFTIARCTNTNPDTLAHVQCRRGDAFLPRHRNREYVSQPRTHASVFPSLVPIPQCFPASCPSFSVSLPRTHLSVFPSLIPILQCFPASYPSLSVFQPRTHPSVFPCLVSQVGTCSPLSSPPHSQVGTTHALSKVGITHTLSHPSLFPSSL